MGIDYYGDRSPSGKEWREKYFDWLIIALFVMFGIIAIALYFTTASIDLSWIEAGKESVLNGS